MPIDLFEQNGINPNEQIDLFERLGISPEAKGWSGIGQDILSSGSEFFGDIADFLTDKEKQHAFIRQAAPEVGGAIKQTVTAPYEQISSLLRGEPTIGRPAKNVVKGLLKGGAGLANIPANIHDYLARKEIISPEREGNIPRINVSENLFPELQEQRAGDKFLQLVGELAPYMAGGELGLAGRGGARALAQRSGALGAHAAGQNEDVVKALMTLPTFRAGGEALRLGTRGAQAFGESLTPSGFLSKVTPNIPTEQLSRALRVTEGTQTPLGDVLRSPKLKSKFENTVAPMLGSGADQIFTDIAENINQRGENIVARMSQNPAGSDSNFIVKDLLTNASRTSRELKNNLWNTTSERGAAEGFNLELPSFNSFINEQRRNIENSPLIRDNPKVQKMYRDVIRYRNNIDVQPASQNLSPILSSSGQPIVSEEIPEQITYPTIREAKILANELGTEANRIFNNPDASGIDKSKAELYNEMSNRLRADVESQIQQKGSPELQADYRTANDYHRDVFSEFLDRDIFPLTRESKSGQSIIRKIIQPSKANDNFEAIQKVNNLLPEDQQEILGFSYLLPAFGKEGRLNPNELNSLINALGPRQFQTLYRPETQQALLDFQELVKMNKESINRMFNPKTGARSTDKFVIISNALAALSTGLATGSATGMIGGVAGAVLGPYFMSQVAKALTRAATSERLRERVVGKKIRKRAEQAQRRQERQENE